MEEPDEWGNRVRGRAHGPGGGARSTGRRPV